jgi:hypothetical protein
VTATVNKWKGEMLQQRILKRRRRKQHLRRIEMETYMGRPAKLDNSKNTNR